MILFNVLAKFHVSFLFSRNEKHVWTIESYILYIAIIIYKTKIKLRCIFQVAFWILKVINVIQINFIYNDASKFQIIVELPKVLIFEIETTIA
jgi:hypothetical protein